MEKTRIGFLFLLLLFVIPFVSAEIQTLGTGKIGDCITLPQVCSNCTYNNISSILYPDKTLVLSSETAMTKAGTYYNYTFCNTDQVGEYIVNGHGDDDGETVVWSYNLFVTPSGYSNILGLFIILIVGVYSIALFGFFGKNVWVAIAGGLMMITLGLFTLLNGIDVHRNFMTESFSFFTIGLGAIFALTAGLELIDENL